MDIQLIRNATLRVWYNGRLFLIDPCLGDKHSIRSFAGISPNPTVELPMPAEAVIADAEMVIVSHLHPDHFDEPAQALLPKDLPLFCQPGNEATLREAGFQQVTPVADSVTWEAITFTRTPGQHGFDELAERMQYAMQAHVERAPNGQLYVPPAAYDAVRKYIVENLAICAQIQHDRRTPSAPRRPARPEQVATDTRVEAQKAKRVIGQTLRPVGKAASSSTRPTNTKPPATVDDAVDSAIEAVLASMNC